MSRVWRRVVEPEQREQRRTTTIQRHNEGPSRTATEPQREVPQGNTGGDQALRRRRALSPLEDDLTYAEVTSGRRSSSPRIELRNKETHRASSPGRDTVTQRKEAPWEEVRRKKQRSFPTTGDTARLERTTANHYPNRRSPPTKRTSSGVVEVSRQITEQPGHHAIDCRRLEVCRICERPGHRAATCPMPSSERSTPQVHEDDLLKKKGKKRKAKNEVATGGTTRAEETTPRQNTEPEKISSHKGSIAIDESTVEEIRLLRSYTIATVTKGYAGSTPSRRVKEELAALVGPELTWSSEPFDDDRILIFVPSGGTSEEAGESGRVEVQDILHPLPPMHGRRKLNGNGRGRAPVAQHQGPSRIWSPSGHDRKDAKASGGPCVPRQGRRPVRRTL
ncbi:hypothetical protein J5N97_018606 [Dioscorea zingiberensis]|uniref:CCHC-type domain-containing protein n=1 Tax=Dioscorea zingiberensis TaxID=325984 RepID=A0A9D5CDH1_9LILI|nr:hypothetical protein J5N97_018606 [Dioscorea zingiberensis]